MSFFARYPGWHTKYIALFSPISRYPFSGGGGILHTFLKTIIVNLLGVSQHMDQTLTCYLISVFTSVLKKNYVVLENLIILKRVRAVYEDRQPDARRARTRMAVFN